jgi:hypothetical protein
MDTDDIIFNRNQFMNLNLTYDPISQMTTRFNDEPIENISSFSIFFKKNPMIVYMIPVGFFVILVVSSNGR